MIRMKTGPKTEGWKFWLRLTNGSDNQIEVFKLKASYNECKTVLYSNIIDVHRT